MKVPIGIACRLAGAGPARRGPVLARERAGVQTERVASARLPAASRRFGLVHGPDNPWFDCIYIQSCVDRPTTAKTPHSALPARAGAGRGPGGRGFAATAGAADPVH